MNKNVGDNITKIYIEKKVEIKIDPGCRHTLTVYGGRQNNTKQWKGAKDREREREREGVWGRGKWESMEVLKYRTTSEKGGTKKWCA